MQFPEQVILSLPETAVELRTYGFGVIPFDGKFTRFRGSIRYDPSTTAVGEVILQIDAGSLAMANELIRDFIIGPEMIDVARFPEIGFRGAGEGRKVVGALSMHGETHDLAMDYARSAGAVTVTGRLRREDWGIRGGQMIGGSIIRISVVLPDPFRPI
jgi:polyisoprenoid-binding protein YceI